MFLALIRKDVRILRPAWLGAITMSLMTYFGICPYVLWLTGRPGDGPLALLMIIGGAAMYMLALGSLFAAICAGTVAPAERHERWADFLAMLPVSRARLVAARAAAAAGVFLVMWGIHALILLAVLAQANSLGVSKLAFGSQLAMRNHDAMLTLAGSAIASLALFGIAWLMAAWLRSAPMAGAIAIVVVVGGLVTAMIIGSGAQVADEEPYLRAFLVVAAIVGVACGVIGTVAQLRRVEP